jgi:hypothetical protein
MFGVERRVERVRQVLIQAFRAKSIEIMTKHAAKKPEEIPRVDLTRSMILHDIAEILTNLSIEKRPEDERE